jgi:replication-associated recombination protein RarA
MDNSLSPSQKLTLERLMQGLEIGNILVLWGNTGMGKTTILRKVHSSIKGAFITMKDLLDAMQKKHPFALEETFEHIVMKKLKENHNVIIDDFHILNQVINSSYHMYPRNGF